MKKNVMKKLTLFAAVLAFGIALFAKPIDVQAAPAAPTDLKQVAEGSYDDAVTVQWTQVVDAYKYGISYSLNKVNWSAETITTSTSKFFYGLSAGQTYYFRIRSYQSYDANSYGAWSNIVAVNTAPGKLTSLKQTNASKNSATFTYSAAAGATGYYIYRGTTSSLSSATFVGNTTATSYTIGNLGSNSAFYVFVVPHRAGITDSGMYCGVVTAPTTPKSLKIYDRYYSKSYKETDFSFVPTSIYDNTDGYQVQVYYIKNGKAKKLKTVTKNTSSVAQQTITVNSSKLYSYAFKYRVRSFVTINGKKIYSGWSSYKTYVPGAVAKKLTYRGYRATSGKLTWGKVNGAKSYDVYYKTSEKGKWKRVAKNVKGTSANVKFSRSKSNYYWIKANGVKVTTKKRANSSSSSKSLDVWKVY